MSQSGVSLPEDCVTAFLELKLGKSTKYIIYKLSDDYTEIVIEDSSNDPDWEAFRQKLIKAESKDKKGNAGVGPRYAVYDFAYELANGEGKRNKIIFIAWSPDDAAIQSKMVYASSKTVLRRALSGVATEIQANDADDLEYDEILKQVRGRA